MAPEWTDHGGLRWTIRRRARAARDGVRQRLAPDALAGDLVHEHELEPPRPTRSPATWCTSSSRGGNVLAPDALAGDHELGRGDVFAPGALVHELGPRRRRPRARRARRRPRARPRPAHELGRGDVLAPGALAGDLVHELSRSRFGGEVIGCQRSPRSAPRVPSRAVAPGPPTPAPLLLGPRARPGPSAASSPRAPTAAVTSSPGRCVCFDYVAH